MSPTNYGKHQPPPATTANILAGPHALWQLELFKLPVRTKFGIQSFEQVKPFLGVCKSGGGCVCVCVCVCARAHVCVCTLCNLMGCNLPGSPVHGILQARILEWVAISSSRGLSDPGVEPVSPASPALAGGFFTTVPPGKPCKSGLVDILDTQTSSGCIKI